MTTVDIILLVLGIWVFLGFVVIISLDTHRLPEWLLWVASAPFLVAVVIISIPYKVHHLYQRYWPWQKTRRARGVINKIETAPGHYRLQWVTINGIRYAVWYEEFSGVGVGSLVEFEIYWNKIDSLGRVKHAKNLQKFFHSSSVPPRWEE